MLSSNLSNANKTRCFVENFSNLKKTGDNCFSCFAIENLFNNAQIKLSFVDLLVLRLSFIICCFFSSPLVLGSQSVREDLHVN